MARVSSDQKYGVHAVSALVSIAEMLLKMGCTDQAQHTAISAAELLQQYPSSPNVPVNMHAEQQLLILKTQVYICVEGSDLEGAKRYHKVSQISAGPQALISQALFKGMTTPVYAMSSYAFVAQRPQQCC